MKHERVNELDLLRFVAALAVVLFHYAFRGHAADALSALSYPLLEPIARYGYLGVDLFFLISGFVILMTAASGNLGSFAVSRIVRLYPAFWVCCTLTFAAIAAADAQRSVSLGQYLVNMTMLGEFLGVPAVDGVYWSLAIEFKFYALVAVVLALGRVHQAQAFLVLWLIATALLIELPIGILRSVLLTDYASYFIAGAMSFLVWSQGMTPLRLGVILAAWPIALYQAVGVIPRFEEHYRSHLNGYAVSGIVTAFFVVMLLVATRRTGYWGRRRWLTIGALTYPLYLLHQNIGYLAFNAGYASLNTHLLLWGTVALMLAAAYAVHVLIERRIAALLKRLLNAALDSGLLRRLQGRLSRLLGRQSPGLSPSSNDAPH
jgi:peptidoglycan/LPS O-acetylase OafA/YrhL